MDPGRVRRQTPISSLVMTFGCKFACQYCPIPAYNQRQHRIKSAARIADEMWRLNETYGLRYFFGTDDNFFNHHAAHARHCQHAGQRRIQGRAAARKARWYTEVTVHDTLQMKDHLPLVREAGCRALWLGVEDMTATLVNKGQSVNKTTEAFQLMRAAGICPMPMMMHHDSQPLYSPGSNYGLLNQVRVLRKAGAVSLQVLMMTPSPGTVLFGQTFAKKLVLASAGGRKVRPYMFDGNYVVASEHRRPWRKQLNLLLAYFYFYNPIWLAVALWRRKGNVGIKPAGMQIVGMFGLVQSVRRTFGWALRLMFGRIERHNSPPAAAVPMRSARGPVELAAHAPVTVTISPRLRRNSTAGKSRTVDLPIAG